MKAKPFLALLAIFFLITPLSARPMTPKENEDMMDDMTVKGFHKKAANDAERQAAALYEALLKNADYQTVKPLLDAGAMDVLLDGKFTNIDRVFVKVAARCTDLDVMKAVIAYQPDFTDTGYVAWKTYPPARACRENPSVEAVRFLLDHKLAAELEYKPGETPLELGLRHQASPDVVAYLIQREAKQFKEKPESDWLMLALKENPHPAVIEYLDKTYPDAMESLYKNPDILFAITQRNSSVPVVEYVLARCKTLGPEYGDISHRDAEGNSLVHVAARTSTDYDLSLLNFWLDKGLNPTTENTAGQTPVDVAENFFKKHVLNAPMTPERFAKMPTAEQIVELERIFGKRGPDAIKQLQNFVARGVLETYKRERGDDLSPLLAVALTKTPEENMIAALLEMGCSPTQKLEGGNTPIHVAAKRNTNHRIMVKLIEAAGDKQKAVEIINQPNDAGDSPLDLALMHNPAIGVPEYLAYINGSISNPLAAIRHYHRGNDPPYTPDRLRLRLAILTDRREEIQWHYTSESDTAKSNIARMLEAFDRSTAAELPEELAMRVSPRGVSLENFTMGYYNDYDNTLLHDIVRAKTIHMRVLRFLVSQFSDVNVMNRYGETPLHLLLTTGNDPDCVVLRFLLDHGADVTMLNGPRKMPINYVEKKPLPNNTGKTPLELARTEAAREIIRGELSLKEALVRQRKDRQLLETFAARPPLTDADAHKRDTFLTNAMNDGCSYETFEKLAEMGALHAGNRDSLLWFACTGAKTDVRFVKLLISKGANPNAEDYFGEIQMHSIARSCPSVEIMRYLVEEGHADMFRPAENGETPLETGVLGNENPDVVVFLLEKCASMRTPEERNAWLKDVISNNPSMPAIRWLVEHKAELPKDKPEVFLRIFSSTPDLEIIRYLISLGGDIHAKDENGNTAAHYAAFRKNNLPVLRFLRNEGAPMAERNKFGKTPRDEALRLKENIEVIRFLDEFVEPQQ